MLKVVACDCANRLVFDEGSSRGAMMATLFDACGTDGSSDWLAISNPVTDSCFAFVQNTIFIASIENIG